MNKQLSSDNTLDKFLTDEQFEQVVEAIRQEKYAWACVLILRFAGYNPLHYIPYRTYKFILKSTGQKRQSHQNKPDSIARVNSAVVTNNDRSYERQKLGAIADLEYLEIASDRQTEIKRGNRELPLDLSHWFYMSE
ncbi:HetP family heterocyst commitment protein [Microseira wollei]|uniref:Heterocyst differentiation protein HetP n=1 Tax=Microseira wollei NIES-4236 TaxID=2530354 RepID=A0AAV3X7R1_9CYAN|nr:HetP family heterocyst commitment protein [Microseira wollei]GET36671.1 heterocyst differentiation protein HetP [Microseira wollei NIES-4236]